MAREPGFYWVKPREGNEWEASKYVGEVWRTSYGYLEDNEIFMINEDRIPEPPEPPAPKIERESGYYWVRRPNEGGWDVGCGWEVMQFCGKGEWSPSGWKDEDLQIDEHRIKREDTMQDQARRFLAETDRMKEEEDQDYAPDGWEWVGNELKKVKEEIEDSEDQEDQDQSGSGKKVKLFVYGTLKSNGPLNYVLKDQKLLGSAYTLADFRLFDLGGCPAMVRDIGERGYPVYGEVWEIDESLLRRLDIMEGVPTGLYVRETIPVQMMGEVEAITYLFNRSVEGRPELTNGVWVNIRIEK